MPAAPEPSRNDSAAAAEAAAAAALQAAEEAKASAAELARQLAANESARREAERQRDEAEAKLAVMAQAASDAAAAEAAAAEEASAEAVVKALRLAEATAAAAAATDASRAAAAAASQAGMASGDGASTGEGEQGKAKAVVTDPFAELPPLPPRPEVSPGSLVMRAIQSGAEAGEEWAAQFAAMLRQAEQDATAFQGELQHREEQFGARLGAIRDEAMARISAARLAARQASVHAERLRMAVDASQAAYLAASQRLDDAIRVRAQRSAARVAAETALTEASAVVTDRVLRLEALDAQRQRLNVLSAAFAARDRARDEESSAHALAVALMGFEAALQEGRPLTDHVQRILGACRPPEHHSAQRTACAHVCPDTPSPLSHHQFTAAASKNDPFLVAVLAPVPPAAQPRHALLASLEDEARHARQLALVPTTAPAGVLSRLLSIAASTLRIQELPDVPEALPPGGGIEACLARATAHLRAGRLLDAALELDGRLGASEAVRVVLGPLAQALRQRAAAEQAHEAARAQVVSQVATTA